jgi:CRISPR/Cas system-associated protein Csm6
MQRSETRMAQADSAASDPERSTEIALEIQQHLLDDLFSTLVNVELFRCAAELERLR